MRSEYAELESLIATACAFTVRGQADRRAVLQTQAFFLEVSEAEVAPWAIASLSATDDGSVSMEPGNTPQSRFSPTDPSSQFLIGFPLWLWLLLTFLGLLLLILRQSRRQSTPQRDSSARASHSNHQPSSKPPTAGNSTINALMEETPNLPDLGSTTPDFTSSPDQEISPAEQEVLSVIQEELSVGKQQVERGRIRVNKRVESREEIVNAPIVHEQVVVERVPFNQVIEEEVPTERDEDGVHIIPVFEEVAVAERQLILREEVRISKKLVTKNVQQVVAVQRGVVEIERTAFESEPSNYIQPPVQPAVDSLVSFPVDSQVDSQADASTNQADQPVSIVTQVEAQIRTKPEETLAVAPNTPFQSDQPQVSSRVSNPEAIADDEIVIPIMAEEAALTVQQVPRGKVQVRTRFDTIEQVLESPVLREELIIEHIPRNQTVEGDPPQIREENGVQIIPVLEEVLVSRKQLLLREEVRISKRRVTESIPQAITLRYEVADIEQVNFEESSE